MRKLDAKRLQQNLEKRINADIAEENIFGASALVRQEGNLIYKNCFGITAPGSAEPVTEDTVFRLASMTKPITAVATLILAERGILNLQDRVDQFFPQYKDMKITADDGNGNLVEIGRAKKPVTVFHLLTHTSGIGNSGSLHVEKMQEKDKQTLQATVEYFAKCGLAFEPFSREWYSGMAAFDVLTAVIEKVTGEDYNTFLHREIFVPLGMTDTTFVPSAEQWSRMIAMHDKKEGKSCIGKTFPNCVFFEFPCTHFLGGAGLISTANDYSKFAEMLLNEGKAGDRQIVSPDSIRLMATPQVPKDIQSGDWRWGLGVRVITSGDYARLPVGAYGWSGAFGTHFWIDPVNRITAVYMKNSLYDGGGNAVTAAHFEEDVQNALC